MKPPRRHVPIQPPRLRGSAGLTLVELMVGLLIGSLFVPLVWTTIRGSIQFFEASIWQGRLERDLDRLTALLSSEAQEACLFGTDAAPSDCAAGNPICAATATPNQLRMLVTLLNTTGASPANAVITYTRDTNNELRRTGPTILADGRLDPDTTPSDQLVMRGVTAFTVTPNDDCNTATIEVTARPVAPSAFAETQGFGNPVTRTIGLRTGSRPFAQPGTVVLPRILAESIPPPP